MPSTEPYIILAPMEGVVDAGMRHVLTSVGKHDRSVTEFVRVTSTLLPAKVFYRYAPELHQQSKTAAGTPLWIQLLGSDPDCMADNAARAAELGSPGIDINFGCPAKTVNRHKGGSVMLKDPESVFAVVDAVRRAVPKFVPVSAKIRLGYEDKSLVYENARAVEAARASELIVHARTKLEGYRPPAHWDWITRIGEAVSIPVVANGDIWTIADYQKCRAVTGCTRFMLGRGAIANPFLAQAIRQHDASTTSWQQILHLLLMYAEFQSQICVESISPRDQLAAAALREMGDVRSRSGRRRFNDRLICNRLKQWLRLMQRAWPQASVLFADIRTERELLVILDKINAMQAEVMVA